MSKSNEELSILIISCREDYQAAKKLSNDLKRYRIPKKLIGQANRDGKVAAYINPAYINLEQAFDPQSAYLDARYAIVLCSPAATESSEVDQWVRGFKQKHSSSKVLCYILSGEPNAADMPDSGLKEAFPDSVKFLVDDQGELTSERTEPIAADSRKHADGVKNANLKLLAGIYAVRYEQLRQRAQRRKRQQIAAAIVLLALLFAYVFNIVWQQRKEDIAKQQQEYETLVQQTFAALNNQSPQAMDLYRQAQLKYNHSLDDKGLLKSLEFRLSHEKLEVKNISKDPAIQFLLQSVHDKKQSAVFGVGFKNGVFTLINENAKRLEFKIDAKRWSKGWNSDNQVEIMAIEIVDNNIAWVIVGQNKKWNMVRLGLKDLSTKWFETQNTTLLKYKEYPDRFDDFERNLNLRAGQSMVSKDGKIGVYDALSEKTFLTSFPASITWDDVSYDITVDWHRKTQKLFVFDKNNAAYQWSYKKDKQFVKFHPMAFDSKIVTDRSNWVIINTTSDEFVYSSEIYHLTDGRHFKIENNHTIHIQDEQASQLHLLSKGIDGSTKEEAYLDANNGEVISRRHIDWQLAVGEEGSNRYYSNNGILYRQSDDLITTLNQWPITCDNNAGVMAMDAWQCLLNSQWVSYPVKNHSRQKAKTQKGYIKKYLESDANELWVISDQKTGTLSRWSNSKSDLAFIKEYFDSEQCFLNLHLAANDLAYVTASKPETAMFEGGPCTAKTPHTVSAFKFSDTSQNEDAIDDGIINLELAVGKGIFKPGYNIAGIYQDLTNLNWYTRKSGEHYRHSKRIKSIELQENASPLFISRNPSTSEMAVTEYIQKQGEEEAVIMLSFLDNNGKQTGKPIVTQKVNNASFAKHMMQHGFSADGQWFWWASFGPDEKINWISIGGGELPTQLPQNFNSALDYLLFSKSERFVLLAAPFSSGSHQVYDLKNQTIAFESSLSQHYQPNFDNVAFHKRFPWLLFEGNAVSLDKTESLTKVDYSGDLKLLDFHSERPWAAGVCAEKYICIADLNQGQIIFHLQLPPVYNSLEKIPQQVRFSRDGKKLFYVIGGRTVVVHDLNISKILNN